VKLSLQFEDNETGHDDLLLTVGDFSRRSDSYYLALDKGVLPDQEDAMKVRAVLRALLGNWRTAVARLGKGATAYLPYDFTREPGGTLVRELDDGELLLRHGWASVEGWAVRPSDSSAHIEPAGFHPDAGPWRVSVAQFMDAIARSIEAAA
jgi:hypothetical protein